MEGDISNKTIVVLVLLTVIISVLSTMVVLNEVMNIKTNTYQKTTVVSEPKTTVGKVSFGINPGPSIATGQVVFGIKNSK